MFSECPCQPRFLFFFFFFKAFLIRFHIKKIPNGGSVLGSVETSVVVHLSVSPTSLALPYIYSEHISAWRGAGCGVEKLLLEVLFQKKKKKFSFNVLE